MDLPAPRAGRRGHLRPRQRRPHPPRHEDPALARGQAAARVQARADVPVSPNADVIVVGAGLAGLVATAELADAGRRVILLDQEPEASLGGQAFWSFGGLFLVDSPEQRRVRHPGLARARAAGLARAAPASTAPRTSGRAGGPRRTSSSPPARSASGCTTRACASSRRRAGPSAAAIWPPGTATRCPRFHITWGTGPGVVEPFERRVRDGVAPGPGRPSSSATGSTRLITNGGALAGVRRDRAGAERGLRAAQPSSRTPVGEFELSAQAVIVTSGGIGANHELVRANWPQTAGHAAAADAVGRARPRRRPDARDQRRRRRAHHQPRPDVALHRGDRELEPDLDPPRDPHPARPVAAVARRAWAGACPCRCSRASTRSARSST